ncbi:MAG: acyl--CoA ligase [Actinobacteria bacterium]|nr:acyl--CoA ligase [Actinomycetota bacterium]
MLVLEMLEGNAERDPDKEAIVFKGRRISYGEYLENVNRVAANMVKLGVKRGDKVALYIGNRPEYAYCYIATISLGAAAVPVSTRFGEAEARFVVSNSNSRFLFSVPGVGGVDFLDIVGKILPECPDVSQVVVLGTPEDVKRIPDALSGDVLFEEPDAAGKEALASARADVAEDDVAFMVYTSGTTGVPKGAMLTQKNIIAYVNGQVDASFVTADDRLLLDIPVNHVGGGVMAIMSMLYSGGTLVILDAFIPEEVLQTVQNEKITVMGQVPAQYILLMMNPNFDDYDVSSVKLAVVASAPSPKELFGQVKEKFGVYLTNGYGLSEVSGAICFTRVDEDSYERLSTSIGKPNAGIEISILDAEGNKLPTGEEGEICVKGDAVMKGYYKMPEETDLVITADGYFRSGDIGTLDEDGYVYILGRKKEMYIRGGENVYPPEVEEVLQEHPGVLFAAVLGVPDSVMGEEGKAFIVPMPGAEPPTEDDIKKWCASRLAKFKVPRYVEFREALPLTPLGKVMKKKLYEELK